MNPQTCTKFGANRSSRLTASPNFWICDPLNAPPPQMPPGYWGRIVFCLCPFPDESADVYQIWCQSVQLFDSFPRHLNLWPSKPPPNAPGILRGGLYLAYVHSQMHPQTCTKFGANRSSSLTASLDFWICDPLKPPKCPQVTERRIVASLCLFPDESADVYQIWCQSVQPFDSFSKLLNLWPPKPPPPQCPRGIEGRIVFSLCPFQDESADMYQIWCQSVQPFDSFPRHLNLWPPKTPWNAPWGIAGRLVISLCPFPVESADVYQIWCQSVQPFDSFPRHLNLWPPKTPWNAPWGIAGRLVISLCPFPVESADVYQIWCQSV